MIRVHYANDHGCSVTIGTDTVDRWAHGWPCSTLRGGSVWALLDSNGDLCDVATNPDADGFELTAMLADTLEAASEQTWRPNRQRWNLARYARTQSTRIALGG